MLGNLIKLFVNIQDFNGAGSVCEAISSSDDCIGLSCIDCPFFSNETLAETIKELKQAQEKQDV